MEKKVEDVLIEMGIYPNLLGFNYICRSAAYIMENSSVRTWNLYDMVAKDFGTTAGRVERGIRHAFSRADKDCEAYKHYMSVKETTNSARLFTLATRLRTDKGEKQWGEQ